MQGTVYLIHLDKPLGGRSSHYIGWAANPDARLWYHKKGKGSRFLGAANYLHISYNIVRIWIGDKNFERLLKNRKNAKYLCPVCREQLGLPKLENCLTL